MPGTFASFEPAPDVAEGLFVAKMLNALGWRRDGWLGTGYDREARYVPEAVHRA